MVVEEYSEEQVDLVIGLKAVYHNLRLYQYSILASLLVLVITTLLLIVYNVTGGLYAAVGHVFTLLVCLVAVDTVSLIFFAIWVIDSIELLSHYARFCRRTGKCVEVIRVDESGIMDLVDYPLWLMILYVVSVTFTTSAAYIIMVLIRYGFVEDLFTYGEGVLASNLLYVLGFILGALASLLIVLLLSRLGNYIGIRTLYIAGLVFSLKYLVDLVSLVYNISLATNIAGIMLTGYSFYWVKRLFKGLLLAEKYIIGLRSTRKS